VKLLQGRLQDVEACTHFLQGKQMYVLVFLVLVCVGVFGIGVCKSMRSNEFQVHAFEYARQQR